ncbi:MAG: WecB/TagA/CpsF family glycosyltransferase [Kiritimatiellae bacterium]|nr:WecB/TagA/CpsF family glycosyltransferase [Kiritimatiellia bacterium]
MNLPPRFSLIDVYLSSTSLQKASELIISAAKPSLPSVYVNVFAVDSVLKCHKNKEIAEIANNSFLTLCDGMPLVKVGKRYADKNMTRCYGPDVMLEVIDKGRAHGLKHFFYGGENEELLEVLVNKLSEKYPGFIEAGRYWAPFRPLTEEEKQDVVDKIIASGADVIWVGIGTPKQDYFVAEFQKRLPHGVLVAVGAAFNFHSGRVKQAPAWMQKHSLEWLYRLWAEPRRLWKRYIIGNPHFILLLLKQWLFRIPKKLGSAPEK